MTDPRDPDPDVRNSPVEEPVRTEPLPGDDEPTATEPGGSGPSADAYPPIGYIDTGPTEGGVGSE